MVVTAASKPSPANLSLAILEFIANIEFQDYNTQLIISFATIKGSILVVATLIMFFEKLWLMSRQNIYLISKGGLQPSQVQILVPTHVWALKFFGGQLGTRNRTFCKL